MLDLWRRQRLPSKLRDQCFVPREEIGKMVVHRSHSTYSCGGGTLELGPAVNETSNGSLKRDLVCGSVDRPCAAGELIEHSSPIGNDERNAACTSLCCDHAEGLGLTTVNQRVSAR